MTYDLAVDIGTTNICVSLFEDNISVYSEKIKNSLSKYGTDIMTRLSHYKNNEMLKKQFQAALFSDIIYLINSFNCHPTRFRNVLIAGNTVMLYFMIEKDAIPLGRYPFEGSITDNDIVHFKKAFIKQLGAVENITIPPIIGGYVGADMFSVLYWINKNMSTSNFMVIDLGTNAELAIKSASKWWVASTAAGPAFGFQGSNLIKNVADGLRSNSISRDGQLKDTDYPVSQAQIRNLQLAKSAIYTGIETLISISKIPTANIDTIYIAGVFGSLLTADDILEIKLIPHIKSKIIIIGNASLSGLEEMNKNYPEISFSIITDHLHFVELANTEQFSVNYVKNMNF
ncbi:MAG: hypothetical protein DKM50_08420 [Candidatus Margulisiibacteriota bacterium]|nr:MAG: hypothetical protein A2X43_03200 [Candidatus Margulisbacteria bacterium GWD2_39_127]OGI05019.1 MAG: hypothetical protein A2X42_05465 [Candidatus Margulisbacteria bacterium GWF2_38_17]OGI09015.1 MAG: hypothetical protein A2X41_01660 [Candidatus Margulisbacteria bacterium GWE2_39_32]PZM79619.1 MAG: hypothetical protein DKM50_08420 [Candidatus Margulisiibacteriota bacterium]HAR63198.1 hypothetical protein [Candidatus Margulisiibacteriota bacterium]